MMGGALSTTVRIAMPVTDTLLANNARYVESFHEDHHPVRPRLKLAVITCMDSRIDAFAAHGRQQITLALFAFAGHQDT